MKVVPFIPRSSYVRMARGWLASDAATDRTVIRDACSVLSAWGDADDARMAFVTLRALNLGGDVA